MPFSLLTIRKHLKPLGWLLGLALLISANPHLAQGLVLCIAENHVEVEAAGTQHHADSEEAVGAPGAASSAAVARTLSQDEGAFYERGAACIDVPLRAGGGDLCHQAVASSQERADVLLPEALFSAAAVFVSVVRATQGAALYPVPSSDVPAASSLRALSSVVLLI